MFKFYRNILITVLIIAMCFPVNVLAGEIAVTSDDSQIITEPAEDLQVVPETLGGSSGDLIDLDSPEKNVEDTDSQNQGKLQEHEWKNGWNEYEGNWYYYQSNGEPYFGWIQLKSKWYYLDGTNEANPGLMACDEIKKIHDKYYAFDRSGAMQVGWVSRSEGWYYADGSGALCSGWIKVEGKWYYLNTVDETNPFLMKSNEIVMINQKNYSFGYSGAMQIGWISRPEGWYYADGSGALCSGWLKVKGKWYYLNAIDEENSFLMKSNEIAMINGKYYSFDGSGTMQTGWISRPEGWYYANDSGDFVSGWKKVGNKWYYLEPDNQEYPCLMVANETKEIDGQTYSFENSGAMKAGWYFIDGNWYYYGVDSGQIMVGWQFIDGYWYYLYEDEASYGIMAKNTVIDGMYVVHDNGAYIRSRNKLGWQNPSNYPQVSSMTVLLPSYCTGYFTYVTPSRISIYASKQECIDAFIARAYEYLGTPYIEPWSSWPGDAVDCSGLVLQCLYATGMDLGIYNPYNHRWLPYQTYNSMNWYHNNTFMPVSISAIQRGDLIYYRGHVAIYLGNGHIIDSWPGQGVSIKPIGSRGTVIGAARPFV